MRSTGRQADYITRVKDLEARLGVPLLAQFAVAPRSAGRGRLGLHTLRPDPRVSERVFHLLQVDPLVMGVAGLGQGGEEWPVAVGLAERAATHGFAPVLLLGMEENGMGADPEMDLRPVCGPIHEKLLQNVCPRGCGARAAGIQGVFQGGAADALIATGVPLEPGGLVLVGRAEAFASRPDPGPMGGLLLVVPYRDVPASFLIEQVTSMVSLGYCVLGMVAVSAADDQAVGVAGHDMEGGVMDKDRQGDSLPNEEPRPAVPTEAEGPSSGETPASEDAFPDEGRGAGYRQDPDLPDEQAARDGYAEPSLDPGPGADREDDGDPSGELPAAGSGSSEDADMLAAAAGRVPVRRSWSDSFGPNGTPRRGRRGGFPWWGYLLFVLVAATAGWLVYRSVGLPADQSTMAAVDQERAATAAHGESGEPLEGEAGVAPLYDGTPTAGGRPVGAPGEELAAAGPAPAVGDVTGAAGQVTPAGGSPARPVAADGPASGPTAVSGSMAVAERDPLEPGLRTEAPSRPVSDPPATNVSPPVETVRPRAPEMTAVRKPPYALLCGSFRDEDRARHAVANLASKGVEARIQDVEIPGQGVWFRILVGEFGDPASAHARRYEALEQNWARSILLVADHGRGPVIMPLDD